MAKQSDPFVEALEKLERAVAEDANGGDAEWIGRMEQALSDVEHAVGRHVAGPFSGTMAGADRPLVPSPGMDRHRAGLREELTDLLAETRILHAQACAADTLEPPVSGQGVAGLVVPPRAESAVNGPEFLERARRLAKALRRYQEKEVDLVQESYTTEVGAGD